MSKLHCLLLVFFCFVGLPTGALGKPRTPLRQAPPVAPVTAAPPPVAVVPAAPSPPPPNLPSGPIVLWGVQRDCEIDADLSQALRARVDGMGTVIHELQSDPGLARACVGSECFELLQKSCKNPLPPEGTIIGGHVMVQEAGLMLLASLRLFRTDFAAGRPTRTFYRYDYIEKNCVGAQCSAVLREVLHSLVLQLVGDDRPSSDPPGMVHNATPPYCLAQEGLRQSLCKPMPIRSRCVNFDAGRDPRQAVHCPFGPQSVATPVKPACNCEDVTGCSLDERRACGAVRGPRLRYAIGGSLLGAGGAFLLTATLLSLNDSRAAILRRSVDCSYGGIEPEPCQSLAGAVPSTWVMGVGLVAGGVAVLLDPLRLFRDRPAPQRPPTATAGP